MENNKIIEKKNHITGGNVDESIDFPNGGFPPIYLCENIQQTIDEKDNKNRQYSTHQSSVSIKDILNKRRDVTPLIIV